VRCSPVSPPHAGGGGASLGSLDGLQLDDAGVHRADLGDRSVELRGLLLGEGLVVAGLDGGGEGVQLSLLGRPTLPHLLGKQHGEAPLSKGSVVWVAASGGRLRWPYQ
jgi:hypothetical protein